MQYYQLRASTQQLRSDREHWSFRTTSAYMVFQQNHSMKVPDERAVALLQPYLYADCTLQDVMAMNGFYETFFVSERAKAVLEQHHLAEDHCRFFQVQITWRGAQYPYHLLHTRQAHNTEDMLFLKKSMFFSLETQKLVAAPAKDQYIPIDMARSQPVLYLDWAETDLFRMPFAGLAQSLFCSDRLHSALEAAGVTGFEFQPAPELSFAQVSKNAKPVPAQFFTILDQESNWHEKIAAEREAKRVEFENKAAYFQALFEEGPVTTEQQAQLMPLLERWVRPCIGIKKAPPPDGPEDALRSRWYGTPMLPEGFIWPRTSHFSDNALLYLGQINLSEVPAVEGLPTEGMLVFFIDVYSSSECWPVQPGRSKVCYFADATQLRPTVPPTDLPLQQDFQVQYLTFLKGFSLPDGERLAIMTEVSPEERTSFVEWYQQVAWSPDAPWAGPRLLGWHTNCQGDVGYEAALHHAFNSDYSTYETRLAEMQQEAVQWQLLMQFDADFVGLGDQLTDPDLYFMVKTPDLQNLRFERAALVGQST
jgi:hypothetical protein